MTMKKSEATTVAIEILKDQRRKALRQGLAVFSAETAETVEGHQFNIADNVMAITVLRNGDQAVMVSQPIDHAVTMITNCFNDLMARLRNGIHDLDEAQLVAVEDFARHANLFADLSAGMRTFTQIIAIERGKRATARSETAGRNILFTDEDVPASSKVISIAAWRRSTH